MVNVNICHPPTQNYHKLFLSCTKQMKYSNLGSNTIETVCKKLKL